MIPAGGRVIHFVMADHPPPGAEPRHLYIMAGYPTAGKSTALWKAAAGEIRLFGAGSEAVIPRREILAEVAETSSTEAKLRAGFWCTLQDLAKLDGLPAPPPRLVMHLDLLLAYVVVAGVGRPVPDAEQVERAFERLCGEPALRCYGIYTVATARVPLEEVQRRWRHRYPHGMAPEPDRLLAEKHRLITDPVVAGPVHQAIHAGWDRFRASLARSGRMAGDVEVRSAIR